jgi:hypothetical protein
MTVKEGIPLRLFAALSIPTALARAGVKLTIPEGNAFVYHFF